MLKIILSLLLLLTTLGSGFSLFLACGIENHAWKQVPDISNLENLESEKIFDMMGDIKVANKNIIASAGLSEITLAGTSVISLIALCMIPFLGNQKRDSV